MGNLRKTYEKVWLMKKLGCALHDFQKILQKNFGRNLRHYRYLTKM